MKYFRKVRRSRCCSSRPILRFFAEVVDLLRLALVCKDVFVVLVLLELLDQLVHLAIKCCILLLDLSKRYSRHSVIHGVVTSFSVTLHGSQDDLAPWLCRSWWHSRSQAYLLVELIRSFHTCRFLIASCRRYVAEKDKEQKCGYSRARNTTRPSRSTPLRETCRVQIRPLKELCWLQLVPTVSDSPTRISTVPQVPTQNHGDSS